MMKYSEALEEIVTGANVAGYFEAEGMISVDSDTELTETLCNLYNTWAGEDSSVENFAEYAARKLLEIFAVEGQRKVVDENRGTEI